MRLDNDTEACDRCGMVLHTALVTFHKCHGTNMAARPANVPEHVWNEALMQALGAKQVVKKDIDKHHDLLDQFDTMLGEFEGLKRKSAKATEPLAQYYSDVASAELEPKKDLRLVVAVVAIAALLVVVGVLLLQR